jgi:hypothetical protein
MTPAAPEIRVPRETVTPPMKELAPDKVNVPLPCLVKVPVPDITPE